MRMMLAAAIIILTAFVVFADDNYTGNHSEATSDGNGTAAEIHSGGAYQAQQEQPVNESDEQYTGNATYPNDDSSNQTAGSEPQHQNQTDGDQTTNESQPSPQNQTSMIQSPPADNRHPPNEPEGDDGHHDRHKHGDRKGEKLEKKEEKGNGRDKDDDRGKDEKDGRQGNGVGNGDGKPPVHVSVRISPGDNGQSSNKNSDSSSNANQNSNHVSGSDNSKSESYEPVPAHNAAPSEESGPKSSDDASESEKTYSVVTEDSNLTVVVEGAEKENGNPDRPSSAARHIMERKKKPVGKEDLFMGPSITQIDPKETSKASLIARVLSQKPENLPDVPGFAYQYLDIRLVSGYDDEYTISFRISKAWLAENYVDKESVTMHRFAYRWIPLKTDIVGEDDEHVYYEATTRGFSYFAISGDRRPVEATAAKASLSLLALGVLATGYYYMRKYSKTLDRFPFFKKEEKEGSPP